MKRILLAIAAFAMVSMFAGEASAQFVRFPGLVNRIQANRVNRQAVRNFAFQSRVANQAFANQLAFQNLAIQQAAFNNLAFVQPFAVPQPVFVPQAAAINPFVSVNSFAAPVAVRSNFSLAVPVRGFSRCRF